LGVLFDRKLTFDVHVRSLADRACSKVNGSRMLANTVKGLSQGHLRTLYRTCVLPVLTYACPVWWTGGQKHAELIGRVQNQGLHHITATFRTTPIRALELEASIPPVAHTPDLIRERYPARLHRLGNRNPVLQRLSSDWRDGEPPAAPPHSPRTNVLTKTARNRRRLCGCLSSPR
jgi:hypothetical protein